VVDFNNNDFCNQYKLFILKNHIMKPNMGTIDKAVRIIAALVIAGLYFAGLLSGKVAIVLLVIAAIFIATSFMSFCPLYYPFGISTRKKE
jgi:hypothetical protein